MDELWKEVKENQAKLNNCTNHNFALDMEPQKRINKKYKCLNCGGTISDIDKFWYELGKKHQINV